MLASWRDGTKSTYSTYITKWKKYCKRNNISFYSPNISNVANFLGSLYKDDLGYQAINCARSALSTFIFINNQPVGKDPVIKRILKGVFEKRPSLKRDYIWDVKIVLDYLAKIGPANRITLKELTMKLVLLLALASAARQQTLRSIKITNIVIKNKSMKIMFTNKLKTTKPNKHLSEINLKAYPDKRLCPIWYTQQYLKTTKKFRGKHKQLLLIQQKPHTPASKDTIARWIRTGLNKAGIYGYTPHSTRSASTSAMSKTTPISTILKTAGWQNAKTFANHYNKKIEQNDSGIQNLQHQ